MHTADTTYSAYLQARFSLANAALVPDASATEKSIEQLQADQKALDEAWDTYLTTDPASTPEQQQAYTSALASWRAVVDQLVPLARANDLEGFVALREEKAAPRPPRSRTPSPPSSPPRPAPPAPSPDQARAAYQSALALLVGTAVLAVALAVVIAVVVSRSVTGPLAKVVDVMGAMAQGHLDRRVGIASKDEVGQLAIAADSSLDALSAALRDIRTEADGMASSSTTLSSVSTQLSTQAEDAAAQTQVVSAASEQVSASISTVAAAGEEMTAAIGQIATATADASSMATTAVGAAERAGDIITRLGSSSREIGDVVALITSIAEQTNLLALKRDHRGRARGRAGQGLRGGGR